MKTWFLTMSVLAAACGGGGGGGGTPGSSTTPTSTPTHYTKWSIGRFGCGFTHEVVPLPSVIKDRYSTSPEITVVSDEQVWGVGEGETLARVCLDDGGVRVMCVVPSEDGESIDRFMLMGGDSNNEDGLVIGDPMSRAQALYPNLACVVGEGPTTNQAVCADDSRPWLRVLFEINAMDGAPGDQLDLAAMADRPVLQIWSVAGPWSDPSWTLDAADDE